MSRAKFPWYIDKDSKWRDLTGPSIFSHIDIPALFPSLKMKDELQELWTAFVMLIQEIKLANVATFATKAMNESLNRSFPYIKQRMLHHNNMHAFAMQGLMI